MIKPNSIVICITLLLLLGACASEPFVISPYVKRGESQVGTSARANVGDIVYQKFDIREQFTGYVTGIIKVGLFNVTLTDTMVNRVLINGIDGGVSVDPIIGSRILPAWAKEWYPAEPMMPLFLFDYNSDGSFDEVFHSGLEGNSWDEIDTPLLVDWTASNGSRGYRRELIYQGRDGDNLKLFYREFNDDFRRSAYDQVVQYDLSKSSSVQFKGLTIEIEEANNEYLIYTIEGGSL